MGKNLKNPFFTVVKIKNVSKKVKTFLRKKHLLTTIGSVTLEQKKLLFDF